MAALTSSSHQSPTSSSTSRRLRPTRSTPPPAHTFSIDTSRAKSNRPVVQLCAERLGFQQYPDGRNDGKPCDIYWHNVCYHDMRTIVTNSTSRVNKFPGMTELAKKIELTRAINTMSQLFPDDYDYYPKSWFIPTQMQQFCDYFQSESRSQWFIVKPDDGAQGIGIYLINNPEQLRNTSQRQLIQEYIADVYLLRDGLKFDFRVYAIIKSLNPLSIHIAREGMARFCTEKYAQPTTNNYDNVYAHLTNYSLNKINEAYIHSTSLDDQMKGSKRLLSTVFHQLESNGVKTRQLWNTIKLIIVKTVLAIVPAMIINYEHYFVDRCGPQCFQIMGFDILLTKDLRPILLEVNASPSLTIDHYLPSPVSTNIIDEPLSTVDNSSSIEPTTIQIRSIIDEMIKLPLIYDTLLLVTNQLDAVYCETRTGSARLSTGIGGRRRLDDELIGSVLIRRKSHLSEIFPARHGANCAQLLFLDKAVYLFMQFINIRKTMRISINGCRNFIRKCNLYDAMTPIEFENHYRQIDRKFYCANTGVGITDDGIPFHGFLELLFCLAVKKYSETNSLYSSVQLLLAYCDKMLRNYGIRSARLRRTVIDHATIDENSAPEIYLLPSRLLKTKSHIIIPNGIYLQQQQRQKMIGDDVNKSIRQRRSSKYRNNHGDGSSNGGVVLPKLV